jgi:hypothetical protein
VRREQEETLDIFDKIKKETGWRVDFIHEDLRSKWGWTDYEAQQQQSAFFQGTGGQATMPPIPPPATQRPRPQSGITNPLYANADFSAPNPPYQGNYVAPTPGHILHSTGLYGFSGITAI